jgi:thiol:disulfide interchange protein DsbC
MGGTPSDGFLMNERMNGRLKMKLAKSALLCATVLLALGVNAQEATIRKNLAERIPQLAKIDEVSKSPMSGLYEIRVNGTEIYYTDAEGNYLVQGNLIDTKQRRNLTEERVDKLTAISFDALPFKDAFTIVRGNGKRKLAVFEDPNCGYCKRFERELQGVDNVTIHLFLYPILSAESIENPNTSGAPKTRPRPGKTGWCATSCPKWRAATAPPSRVTLRSDANTRSRVLRH